MSEYHTKKQGKFVPTLKYTAIAIVASTLFIAIVLLIVDRTSFGADIIGIGTDTGIVIIGTNLSEDNLPLTHALIAGFVVSVLPIFLFVVFSFTGIIVFLSLAFALLSAAIALAIPAGIMALPLLLIVGLVYLLMRKKSTD